MILTSTGQHDAENCPSQRLDEPAGRSTRPLRAGRRRLLQAVIALAALPSGARASTIETLKVVIGAQAGAPYDLVGRSLGAAMIAAGQAQSAVYDNKGGSAGVSALLDFASDEHGNAAALMVVGSKLIGLIDAGERLDALHRMTPIARLSSNTLMIVVAASSPVRQMADLVLRLQAQPGSITWGGSQRGSVEHVLLGLLARKVRIEPGRLNYVPLASGRDVATALQSGHLAAGVGLVDDLLPLVRRGGLRALAVTSAAADAGVPSLRQLGIDLEVGHWRGVFAPTGLDSSTRGQMIDAVRQATEALSWKQSLVKHGWSSAPLFGDAFGSFVLAERRRFEGVLNELGVATPRPNA